MKSLLKPSCPSNLYHAAMRSPSFGLPSRDQITRLDLRERCAGVCCCSLTHTNTIPHCMCLLVAESCVEGRA